MFRAEISDECIVLWDGTEELVYWDRQEWIDDPALCVSIANAVKIGYTQGADAVRTILAKH